MVRFGEKGGALLHLFIFNNVPKSPLTTIVILNTTKRISTIDLDVHLKPFFEGFVWSMFGGP